MLLNFVKMLSVYLFVVLNLLYIRNLCISPNYFVFELNFGKTFFHLFEVHTIVPSFRHVGSVRSRGVIVFSRLMFEITVFTIRFRQYTLWYYLLLPGPLVWARVLWKIYKCNRFSRGRQCTTLTSAIIHQGL